MVLFFAKPNASVNKSNGSKAVNVKRRFSCRNDEKVIHFQANKCNAVDEVVSEKRCFDLNDDSSFLQPTSAEAIATSPASAAASVLVMSTLSAHRSLPRQKEAHDAGGAVCAPSASPLCNGSRLQRQYSSSTIVCRDDSSVALGCSSSIGGIREQQLGSSSYELSSDFQQKQTEALERRYGGRIRARRAAIIIQRAYRKYAMTKKFEHLRKHRMCSNKVIGLNASGCGRCPTKFHALPPWTTPALGGDQQYRQLDQLVASTTYAVVRKSTDDYYEENVPVDNSPLLNNGYVMGGAARLKLHKYNVGGRTHLSAPLTAQLRADRQQQEKQRASFQTHVALNPSTTTHCSVVNFKVNDTTRNPRTSHVANVHRYMEENRQRSVSVERGSQYTANTSLNLVPTTTAPPTNVLKILSHENDILNRSMSPSSLMAESCQRELCSPSSSSYSALPPHLNRMDIRNTSQYVSSVVRSSTISTRGPVTSNVTASSDVGHCRVGVDVDRHFYPTVRLAKKFPVHHTNSADSVQDLCTPSSDSGVSHAQYSATSSADNSPRRTVVYARNVQSATPVWIPRQDTAQHQQKILLEKKPHSYIDTQKPSCSSDVDTNGGRALCRETIPAFESRQLHNFGRRSLLNSSIRRTDLERKRQYRIALNFFNKKPEKGVNFLIKWNFVEGTPLAVAKFLISRKGVSKQMIGEYLGNLQNPFNMAVLDCFVNEVNLQNLEVDAALRQFQSLFRLPGEAQKIERIVEVFARRYCECNLEEMKLFKNADTVFILAFAIIMLNTDLHSPNIKAERRMKVEDFIKNLRGIDCGADVNQKYLTDLFLRVKEQEFKPGSDHVTQVLKVERSINGKKPTMALPHRRLVCYCRLYEVLDPLKKQSPSAHQREVFLFNDMLVITKISAKKKNVLTYNFRQSNCLVGMQVSSFRNQLYSNGLRITHNLENIDLHFNARNEEDRTKFVEDLHEAILESDEMESLRISLELEKQNHSTSCRSHSLGRNEQQRDSGLAEIDLESQPRQTDAQDFDEDKRKKASSTSSLNVAAANKVEVVVDQAVKRATSGTSLDSGMSSTASLGSHEASPLNVRPQISSAEAFVTENKSELNVDGKTGSVASNSSLRNKNL